MCQSPASELLPEGGEARRLTFQKDAYLSVDCSLCRGSQVTVYSARWAGELPDPWALREKSDVYAKPISYKHW